MARRGRVSAIECEAWVGFWDSRGKDGAGGVDSGLPRGYSFFVDPRRTHAGSASTGRVNVARRDWSPEPSEAGLRRRSGGTGFERR